LRDIFLTRIIAVLSGKGGVGKTTVATNLGIALSNFKKKVILVDCNLSTPHLSDYLGTNDFTKTLNDALLGNAEITSALYQHNGVMFVPASTDVNDLIGIDVMKFKKNIRKLENPEMIDFIILDSAPGLGRESLAAAEAADEILFVTNPLETDVNDVRRCIEVTKELGKNYSGVVLNMVEGKTYEMKQKKIKEELKLPILGTVPFDRNFVRALVKKMPMQKYKPHSKSSSSFMKIAAKIIGEDYKPSTTTAFLNAIDFVRTFWE